MEESDVFVPGWRSISKQISAKPSYRSPTKFKSFRREKEREEGKKQQQQQALCYNGTNKLIKRREFSVTEVWQSTSIKLDFRELEISLVS
ncbi:hypothetical protein K0M31_013011 [Melipona bicolor]|uniref:Uncharacterized protein n=1 Tax=Melipona bicolor TaxID=60889 RepID=A0AA40KGP7_9HYME|nr:hypothetical protein K0M31_013011 [Melipona bicolor]